MFVIIVEWASVWGWNGWDVFPIKGTTKTMYKSTSCLEAVSDLQPCWLVAVPVEQYHTALYNAEVNVKCQWSVSIGASVTEDVEVAPLLTIRISFDSYLLPDCDSVGRASDAFNGWPEPVLVLPDWALDRSAGHMNTKNTVVCVFVVQLFVTWLCLRRLHSVCCRVS